MTRPSDIGGYNFLGLKEINVDEAFDRGLFDHLALDQQVEARRLFADIAKKDPVSRTFGYTALKGVYENQSGQILDTTKARSTAWSFLDSLTENYGLPIVGFNPLQMLGVGGPRGVSKTNEIELVPGTSRQAFLGGAGSAPDVYAWAKKSNRVYGGVGKLYGISEGAGAKLLPGEYKRFSSVETDLYSRAARLASNRQSVRKSEIDGSPLTRREKFKRKFDIDEEQPNSIFRYAGRLGKKYRDIDNPQIMGQLITEGKVTNPITKRSIQLLQDEASREFSVVDQAGKQTHTHTDVLKAFDAFRIQTEKSATPRRVMRANEEKFGLPQLDIGGGRKADVSGINTAQDLVAAAEDIRVKAQDLKGRLRYRGVETEGLTRQVNRLTSLAESADILSSQQIKSASPSITSRADYLRNVLHRTLVEMHAYENMAGNPTELAIKLEEALAQLSKEGLISGTQLSEARAAGLSTVLNIASFKNFRSSAQNGANAGAALGYLTRERNNNDPFRQSLRKLAKPYVSQSISNVGAVGFTRYTSSVRPAFKKLTSVSPYQLENNAENPLGNEGLTFVPTFGTVLDRAVSGETSFTKVAKNVLGINSYSDPGGFSAASIPAMHLSDRLNRYPGTIGLGLTAENYGSPASFFLKGLVSKRVLPIFAAGTTALAVDRTIGGYTQPKDGRGERVYSPYFGTKIARGAVEAQSIASGITPGGMGYGEKKEQLLEGEVGVRQGRYWPLGVTPFKGGKVAYYRPSYYRRMQAGGAYTSDSFDSPMERLAFGYDFSPLRPFDPYRFERENYYDRPTPLTGDYFTGPFGPVTPALNLTVGKILKPQVRMHQQEVANALSQYVPAGAQGSYDPTGIMSSGRLTMTGGGASGYVGGQSNNLRSSPMISGAQIGNYNSSLVNASYAPLNTAKNISLNTISTVNQGYLESSQYGPPPVPGFIPPPIAPTGKPIQMGGAKFQASEFGYRAQEMAGIYGFGFANAREGFGFGRSDFQPNRAVLQSASKSYGIGRSFWDLNLGGLGDVPLGMENGFSGLELSEITRRFIPKERTDITYLNPIKNTMGQKYPFLPGSDYFTNFQTGDPFTKIQEGELRLPGVAYERLNPTKKDYTNPITQLDILGDVAPYSRQYRALDRQLTSGMLSPSDRVEAEKIRAQVDETTRKNTFKPYKYKYGSAEELGISQTKKNIGKFGEYIAHRDTFINTKLSGSRTAQENWERRNVYGATFPQWQKPIDSFIKPIYNKSTQRNPLTAGLLTAGIASLFAKKPGPKMIASTIGFATGTAYGSYHNVKQKLTGDRFIPKERKKQLALEEYTDILSYVKNRKLSNEAAQAGDSASAAQFSLAAKRTMYGADLFDSSMPADSYGNSIDTLSLAIPKRKREHFKAMIAAPEEERDAILSTAPRLERRIYQAAWGRPVEEKPDLTEFFSRHELPDLGWEGWHPNTSMEQVKIKMGNNLGIDMSQMGYYPQQIREANLVNPSYPNYQSSQDPRNVSAQLRLMMSRNGINGSVTPVRNNGGGSAINISSGLAGIATLI